MVDDCQNLKSYLERQSRPAVMACAEKSFESRVQTRDNAMLMKNDPSD